LGIPALPAADAAWLPGLAYPASGGRV